MLLDSLKRIIELSDETTRIRTNRSMRPENWYDSEGHVVVVGEAAHQSIVSYVSHRVDRFLDVF